VGTSASRAKIWLALWIVYLGWGSAYLAIRVGVHPSHGAGVPPLLFAGARFILAGLVMLVAAVRRPAADGRPDPLGRRQWSAAVVLGFALPFGGTGLVSLAEQRIPSGTAALLWAGGSVWSTVAPSVRRPMVSTGLQMLCGGLWCVVIGAATDEGSSVHRDEFTLNLWLAFAFLVVAGSLLSYGAYVWLLANAELALVTTSAFVNPVVAVILGAVVLSEPFTIRSAIATVAVIGGVILMIRRQSPNSTPPAPMVAAPDEVSV
jgi:drug/metabolite transporter (DMT)-like permease